MSLNGNRYVIGVDFGTLSGRAVVVRAGDGAELGSAVHEYAHRVIEGALPGGGVRLGPDWALQSPGDWVEVLRVAVPGALAAAGVPAERGDRDRHRLHRVYRAAGDRRRDAVVRADARPAACLAEAVEAPRGAARTPTGSTRWPPGGVRAWLPRYGGKISSEWQFAKGLQVLRGGSGGVRAGGAVDRGCRLDRVAADRGGDPQRVRRRVQGDLPGRAAIPSAEFLAALDPGFAGFTGQAGCVSRRRSGGAGGAADRARRPAGPGCPRGSRSRSATSTRMSPSPAADAVRPGQMVAIMGTSTCHVMPADRAGGGARACAGWSRRNRAGAVGVRGGAVGRRRHLRAGSSRPRCRARTARRPRRWGCRCTST